MAGRRKVELLLDVRARLAEGVVWDAGRRRLCWVNILDKEVHLLDTATGADKSVDVGQYVGVAVPCSSGRLIMGLRHGIATLDVDRGTVTVHADPEHDKPLNRFNDGKCDAAGRFWCGSMQIDCKGRHGSLYRVERDFSVHRALEGIGISNGLAWSRNGRKMYYIDTPQRAVWSYDYDMDTGRLGRRRTVVEFDPRLGKPDGMTIDEEGMLWVAMWGGGMVTRWDPRTGDLLEDVKVPASQVSCCAFGGRMFDELYISTARVGLSERELRDEPQAGGIFVVKPGARGLPPAVFADA